MNTVKQIDTTPEQRVVNGRIISFYSPAQLEQMISVEQRQPKQRSEFAPSMPSSSGGRHYRAARASEDVS